NSLNAASRLKETEFGYRSLHYVIQMRRAEILGVNVPRDKIGDRKAEIQVRTVAQHAWAAITHDRLYKGTFNVPTRLTRLGNPTAALLEEADEALNNFEAEMQAYLGSYTAYMKPEQLEAEIEVVRMVLDAEPENRSKAGLALRLGRLLRAAGTPAD